MFFSTFLVVLVDRQHGQFYQWDNELKRLEKIGEIFDDVPQEVKGASWKGLADDKVARHVEEHRHGHYRHLVEAIERHAKRLSNGHEAGIILGGSEDNLSEFIPFIPNHLQDQLVVGFQPDPKAGIKILEEQVSVAVAAAHERYCMELLNQIEESRQPKGKAAVGEESAYEALNMKEAQTVILNPEHTYQGQICAKDGSLSVSQEQCPICMGPMEVRSDLKDAIRELAAKQSAEVVETSNDLLVTNYHNLAVLRRF